MRWCHSPSVRHRKGAVGDEVTGMGREDRVYMRVYTTDVDGFLTNYDVYADWIGQTGLKPPQTLLGVQRLALPEFMVEIEALAAA